jgi:hypothetical protein
MIQTRSTLVLLGTALLLIPACGGGDSGGAKPTLDLSQVSNGFGQILPHTALKLDANGNPTSTLISIRTEEDLISNVTSSNPILPTPQFPTTAILPSGAAGNHFIYAEFTSDLDIASVLDGSPGAQPTGSLTGTVTLNAIDSVSGSVIPVQARAFINGRTYAGTIPPGAEPPTLPLQTWVALDEATGLPTAQTVDGATPGAGFPGVGVSYFTGAEKLISPRTVVFVADSDGDLSTFETFPAGRQIRLKISTSVRNTAGKFMLRRATGSTTVGADTLRPEVARTPPPLNNPLVTPSNGSVDVDPLTNIRVEFTEAIQPSSLGSLPTGMPPLPSSALAINFGPPTSLVSVPFNVRPVSVYDLTEYEIIPAFNFPGEGPPDQPCGVFNAVTVKINAARFSDLSSNINLLGGVSAFTTGQGPGIVNAPVAPDVIYMGRTGAVPGLSVVDLNGFGQSTGNPTFSQQNPQYGNSNFPNNPNVAIQGSALSPPLQAGTCTIDGGSAGAFTLTRDSSLNDLLVRAPVLTAVGDMMLGHALDSTFNNGPAPFGCQSGGGNLCAFDQIKIINPTPNGNTLIPTPAQQANGVITPGAENLISWAPHPNPPPLVFPPICISPYIGGQEPTSIDVAIINNLLGPGDPFGQPLASPIPIPPSGLLSPEQNNFFQGPSYNQTVATNCLPYMIRQQIGQYLYCIDRGRREIVVLNSNRMTVIDRIATPDPTSLAMSPNLSLLAVSNQLSDIVTFIDIDPNSATFHTVVQETLVGSRPRGIAWEPGDEDVLVANEADSTVTIISGTALTVRKVISSQLNEPFEVAITPRQLCWGFNRQVYFAYILNRNGRVAIYESGPNTVNGWGYDDVIGTANSTFYQPKAMQVDPTDLRSALWIAHQNPINIATNAPYVGQESVGAVSKLVIETAIPGALPLNVQSLTIPQFRDMYLGVPVSLGTDKLSGVPVDLAFDNMRNLSGLPNTLSTFTGNTSVPVNGKGLVKAACPAVLNANEPRYLFVAVPTPLSGSGVVDVIRIDQGNGKVDVNPFLAGVQSVPAPNVQVLMDYFRQ